MKKGLLFLLALCVSGMVVAQEAELQTADSVKIKGVHPYKLEENAKGIAPEIAHWSIIPRIGFSVFDGDFTNEKKHAFAIPSAGLAVEYNFTPVWNIGVEYMYDQYTVTGKQGLDENGNKRLNADTLLNGHLHRAGVYISMDLINLLFPRVNKKIFSMLPYVGAGGAWYKRSAYYMDDRYFDGDKNMWINPTHGRGNTVNYINADGQLGPDKDTKYIMEGYVLAGVDLDFNINRTIALGLRANYTYFTRDYFDGRGYHHGEDANSSKNNDGIYEITANLRFKLEAVSKSHPRNMPSFDKFDEWLEDAKVAAQCEPCHDTIIYYRHDSIIIREVLKQPKPKEVFNVYFDNDKSVLRQDGLVKVSEVAERMEDDKNLYAVVIGYCDNTGSNGHNFGLGDRRAFSVVDELAKEYDIPADHLYGKGTGKLVGRRSKKSYGPNRRAAIHLVDEETFELMKMQLEDKSENRDESMIPTFENSKPVKVPDFEKIEEEAQNDSVKTIPLSESARKEKVNEYKERKHETITVEKGVSLSKLARKYYDNTQCWVFIYAANREKLATPNDVQEGMKLVIPELTEEELKITTRDCLRIYSIVAHSKE